MSRSELYCSNTLDCKTHKFFGKIDDNDRYLISGFCRHIFKGILIIPIDILNYCALYAFMITNEWCTELNHCREVIHIHGKQNNQITTQCELEAHTIYHRQWIHSQSNKIVQYRLKLNRLIYNHNIYIGISSKDSIYHELYPINNGNHTFYMLQGDGYRYTHHGCRAFCGKYLSEGDDIKFILDVRHKKIRISVNRSQEIIIFDSIRTGKELKYKLAICLKSKSPISNENSVTLVNVTQK